MTKAHSFFVVSVRLKKLVTLAVTVACSSAWAAWPTDAGQDVVIAVDELSSPQPILVSDGLGGFYVVWTRNDPANARSLRGDHFAADGTRLWPLTLTSDGGLAGRDLLGMSLGTFAGASSAVTDGQGGLIAIYLGGDGSAPQSMNVQRFTDAGAPVWTAGPYGGEQLQPAPQQGSSFEAVADGKGGAVLVFEHTPYNVDMYLQRVDSAGAIQYGAFSKDLGVGQGLSTVSSNLAADGDGGAYLIWNSLGGSSGQPGSITHVDPAGTPLFTQTLALQGESFGQFSVAVQPGSSGPWAAWFGYNPQKVFVQHFQEDGGCPLTAAPKAAWSSARCWAAPQPPTRRS